MRSTVGPLPPAVYWRRRAVVLGVLLLAVILLFVACTGGDDEGGGQGDQRGGAGTPTGSSTAPTPAQTTSFAEDAPAGAGGPSRPAPGDLESLNPSTAASTGTGTGSGTGTGQNTNATAPADGSCADGEVAVTPVPAATTLRRGDKVEIRLRIKNLSDRACSRDLGAEAQELYIDQGTRKAWSSDTCSTDRRSGVVRMAAGADYEYAVTWNGRQTTKCSGGLAAGPAPDAGQYELRGRLGTKLSDPVRLVITS